MRYFVECTHTHGSSLNTGIQRVVRNVVNQSLADPAREVVPVILENGRLLPIAGNLVRRSDPPAQPETSLRGTARQVLSGLKGYVRNVYNASRQFVAALLPVPPLVRFLVAPRHRWGLTRVLLLPLAFWRRISGVAAAGVAADVPGIEAQAGDVLVLLDSSWHLDIWPAVLKAQEQGALVVCVIYDLIPFSHPQFCDEYLVGVFNRWMGEAMLHADAFLCISRTIADEVRQAVPAIAPGRSRPLHVSYFWLGCELDGLRHAESQTDAAIEAIRAMTVPVYLYVSTVEPRKNHAYALSAFEQLWERGVSACFVVVGRVGWRCNEFIQRVRSHPQLGQQLFMFNDADDHALAQLYDRANGLIFTSITEGFGLPIVESLQRGVPVFASDIAVFREIGAEGVRFVDLGDPRSLVEALLRHGEEGAPRLANAVTWLTWEESTRQFWSRLEAVVDEARTVTA